MNDEEWRELRRDVKAIRDNQERVGERLVRIEEWRVVNAEPAIKQVWETQDEVIAARATIRTLIKVGTVLVGVLGTAQTVQIVAALMGGGF